jgi:hypothetical protein
MKKSIFNSLTALILILASCSKGGFTSDFNMGSWGFPLDTPGTGIITNIVSSFYSPALDYIKLPVNRYFIYKDSASGSSDTIIVLKSVVEIQYNPPTHGYGWMNGYYYSTFNLDITNATGYNRINCTMQSKAPLRTDSVNIIDSNFMLTTGFTSIPVFWYPFVSRIVPYGQIQYTYIPTLLIEGVTYTEVHKFSSTNWHNPSQLGYLHTEFYWVKGIGFVKKVTADYYTTKTLLLLKYG